LNVSIKMKSPTRTASQLSRKGTKKQPDLFLPAKTGEARLQKAVISVENLRSLRHQGNFYFRPWVFTIWAQY